MTVDEDLDKLLENLPFFIQENLKNRDDKIAFFVHEIMTNYPPTKE